MQLVATLAVVASVLVLAWQGRALAGHTRVANEVAGTQTHREILFHYKSVVDAFLQYPELHDYYFDNTTATPSATQSVRLKVIADQHADWLEVGFITSRQLASYEHWVGEWAEYVPHVLASSTLLRSTIRHNPPEWPSIAPFVADYDAAHDQGADRPAVGSAPTAGPSHTPKPEQD